MAARKASRPASMRARIRQELQALAVDLDTPAVRAFIARLDRLRDIEASIRWNDRRERQWDPQCPLAHVTKYGETVGALAYLTGAGLDFADMRARLAELAPHLRLEIGAPATADDAEAWLRRQFEKLGP
jgi:hypothetical protein